MHRRYKDCIISGGMIIQAPSEARHRLVWFVMEDDFKTQWFTITSQPGPDAFCYEQNLEAQQGKCPYFFSAEQIRAKLQDGGWKVIRNFEYEGRKCSK